MCLFVSEPLIRERGIMTYKELLAATITPENLPRRPLMPTVKELIEKRVVRLRKPYHSQATSKSFF